MIKNIHLLLVDPQNDFCDLPVIYQPIDPLNSELRLQPQLPVAGAHADMHRLAQFVHRAKDLIHNITITLDSHHHVGIERPTMWRMGDGSQVQPFTQVAAADVIEGKIVPLNAELKPAILNYLHALEAAGRYKHMVWPVHCEIGTWGHNIHADVLAACNVWERYRGKPTAKVIKGTNPLTEHYSALIAEVPDKNDPSTLLNQKLLDSMLESDTLLVAGEAGSHCVKSTMEHYLEYASAEQVANVVLLTDCMSTIAGFEESYQGFLDNMAARGATLTTAAAWLASQRQKP